MPTQRIAVRIAAVVGALIAAFYGRAQSPDSRPAFEVATVKPTEVMDFNHCAGGDGPAGPGRLVFKCTTVVNLIQQAYAVFANGLSLNPQTFPISGGPAWLDADHYDITAKANGNPPVEMMLGPMLQALLEDRFKLKLHRETREVPVYALTVAKSGLKLKPLQKPDCTPADIAKILAPSAPGQPPPNFCGAARFGRNGGILTLNIHAMSLKEFSQYLARGPLGPQLDRPTIDKTGIDGTFDFHLEFTPDQNTPGFLLQLRRPSGPNGPAPSDDPSGPSIFTAVQEQVGLKLEPTKGPGEFMVVDHVEKPSDN
jgi:uncharacterized protein (TIGR03435 family)